jgi:methionyl-tRNA formyltransferase
MLEREDGRIDWTMTAADVYNRMRGFAPWPGAFAEFRGKLVHLWGRPAAKPPGASGLPAPGTILPAGATLFVACGSDTWLALVDVQPEGRRWMSAREFSNGARIAGGERFK